jgi:hypothetical protein
LDWSFPASFHAKTTGWVFLHPEKHVPYAEKALTPLGPGLSLAA